MGITNSLMESWGMGGLGPYNPPPRVPYIPANVSTIRLTIDQEIERAKLNLQRAEEHLAEIKEVADIIARNPDIGRLLTLLQQKGILG